jgi:hypothetical protein
MDRVVPLPGFDMEAFPFVFVNDRDIMDVRAGDLVDACDQLTSQSHICSLKDSQLMISYKKDALCLVALK